MAQDLESSSNTTVRRYTSVQGPIKLEYILLTLDGSQTIDNPDTVTTLLQNPLTVTVLSANTDDGGTKDGVSAVLSGKTISIHDLSVSTSYLVTVVGF